jgi:hypothetical protein
MAATSAGRAGVARDRSGSRTGAVGRLSTETKQAFKTTEFWAMVVLIVGILIASAVISDGNGPNDADAFPASRAWLYVAIVGVGYIVSRGLAKAGSRDFYWADDDDRPDQR